MTSTLYLYKDSKIIPSKNFVVDSLEDYLETLTKITILDFQFLRNDLNLFIKINKSQDYSGSLSTYNYNYLKVVQNGVSYYYFILKKTQVSQSTIGLELKRDTLNTYKWDSAFKVSARTQVNREHKERLFRYIYEFHSTRTIDSFPYGHREKVSGKLLFSNGENTREIADVMIWKAIRPVLSIGIHAERLSREDSDWLFENRFSTTWNFIGVEIDGITYSVSDDPLANLVLKVNLLRNIDYLSEGMDIPLYKKELGLLTNKEDSTWNLVYHNDNDEAINCHCIPSETDLKAFIVSSQTLTYTDFENGVYYKISPVKLGESFVSQEITIEDNDEVLSASLSGNETISGYLMTIIQILRSGTTLKIRTCRGYGGLNGANHFGCLESGIGAWKTITTLSYQVEDLYYRKASVVVNPLGGMSTDIALYDPEDSFTSTGTYQSLDSLKDVDRIDSQLIKIISIPYFPSEYTFINDNKSIAIFDSTWTYSTSLYHGYRLNNLNQKFVNTIESSVSNPLNILVARDNAPLSNPDLTQGRIESNESKLFHSDFYQPKFVYDSFGFTFGLERIEILDWLFIKTSNFTFNFVMTSTINSKFLFSFPEYVLKYSSEDYDNVLTISRNNEAPIYNSAYITYLRTAYRYDLKALNNSQIQRGINFGLGTGQMSISVVEDMLTKDYGSAISSYLSWGKSLVSNIFSAQKERIALQSKLESLRAQANSVSGSDDLDLLDYYSQNRAKLCLYQVSDRMKKLIYDLFYYYGYSTNEIKIPEINTRKWFNFLSCDLVYTGIDNNINDSCKEDIVNRYKEGATFLHMNELSSVKTWDFEQVKENWESSLFE